MGRQNELTNAMHMHVETEVKVKCTSNVCKQALYLYS